MTTAITGFLLLYYLCQPFNILKRLLFITMIALFVLQTIFLKELYSLTTISVRMAIILAVLTTMTVLLFQLFSKFVYQKLQPR